MQMGEAEDMAKRLEASFQPNTYSPDGEGGWNSASLGASAAALIRAQEAEIAELRKALEPFAAHAGRLPGARDDYEVGFANLMHRVGEPTLFMRDFRRARAELERTP
jgi:hypothetical protein